MNLSVSDAAREHPDRAAIVYEDRTLRFEALAREVALAIERQREQGIGPADLVAIAPRGSFDDLLWVYARMELHAPFVLVHPRLTSRERGELLGLTGASVIVDKGLAQRIAPRSQGALPQDALAVVSTSGTTGRPRAVVLGRGAFVASAVASAANLGWEAEDRWLLAMPLAHVGGLSIVTRCLIGRSCVALAGDRFDPARARSAIVRHRVTIVSVVPTMLHRLIERSPRWDPPAHVRVVLVGGAHAPVGLLRSARSRGWPVLCTYGLTEACSQVATQRYGVDVGEGSGVGPPLPGIDVRVVAGGIEVRGPTMMHGYLGGGEGWCEGGWFPTGDVGNLDESGYLHVSGRRADRILRGGENVDPAEVEEQLEQCEGVEAACVFGVDDAEWGQQVAAAIVGGASVDRVDGELRERLAGYKCPTSYCSLRALRIDSGGKLDRAATAREALAELRSVRPSRAR